MRPSRADLPFPRVVYYSHLYSYEEVTCLDATRLLKHGII